MDRRRFCYGFVKSGRSRLDPWIAAAGYGRPARAGTGPAIRRDADAFVIAPRPPRFTYPLNETGETA